jgi:putative DNA primase/helicase
LDLKTGDTRPGEPEDYIRKIAETLWQGAECPCPRFEQFLHEIFAGDREKIYFVQRLLGYSLVGLQIDHILPVFCGEEGRNGKTVLLNILRYVLGPYISPASEEILLSGKKNPGAATPFLVMLQGKRMVYITETNEGDRLNAGTVKQLTGGDEITARNLYGKPFFFWPSHTVFLITNHTPHANSDDEALWERVFLIEFTQRFIDEPTEPNEHKRDPYLIQELEKEASGILAWLVRGCMRWQNQGLLVPQCVKIATETYRQGEDSLGTFLEENCQEGDFSVLASEFYSSYKEWSTENGIKPMSSTAFGKRMSRKFEKKRENNKVVYLGIKLAVETVKIDLNL